MTGFIYAIGNADGLVKIGWSSNPRSRLSKINSDTSSPCALLGYVEGTREQEAALHLLLSGERAHAEWYRRGPAVSLFVSALPKPATPAPRVTIGAASALAQYRASAGLTMQALAAKLGVDKSAVCKWEARKVPAERVRQIEAMTGIPASVLRPDIFQPQPQGEAA